MTLGSCRSRVTKMQKQPESLQKGHKVLVNFSQESPAKLRYIEFSDNSNDSGLGFDNHGIINQTSNNKVSGDTPDYTKDGSNIIKKVEHQDINKNLRFFDSSWLRKDCMTLIRTTPIVGGTPAIGINNNSSSSSGRSLSRCTHSSNKAASVTPTSLTTQLSASSRFGDINLVIVKQPEQQHRARYQTEGSRGAVKDREGNGFPVVQLTGYYKPTTLQIFIGTDVGKVAPHMFYQACKVSGKNSTPCIEKKIDGTCVIELTLEPLKEMSATCDCVGILKERNVDVEHRFPDQLGNRSKKKSTRCRMIFRTTIALDNGTQETLQACSQPIVCTQPPGVPEICKKSLTSCSAAGGLELFVIGKNFLKDTKVFFQEYEHGVIKWEAAVVPDKEYLQQTHFVCMIPPYKRTNITESVSVRLCVVSSGKTSESQQFLYTPLTGINSNVLLEHHPIPAPTNFLKEMIWPSQQISKCEEDLGMMPPPETSLVPLANRRPSITLPSVDIQSSPIHSLKQEYVDENSQNSIVDPIDIHQERYRHFSESSLDVNHGDSNMSVMNENSVDMINHNSMIKQLNENSNMSVTNDDSIDLIANRNLLNSSNLHSDDSLDIMMIHHNSIRRPVSACDNSIDVNVGSTNMSAANEDSCCSTIMQNDNSAVTENIISNSQDSTCSTMEKVMDLRMKNSSITDFGNTPATSDETLQRFQLPLNDSLLPQSAQSIENYLTRIECTSPSKNDLKIANLKTDIENSNIIISSPICHVGSTNEADSIFNFSRIIMPIQNDSINNDTDKSIPISASESDSKIDAVDISNSLNCNMPPTNTEKLDEFVNSTVDCHIGNKLKCTSKNLLLHDSLQKNCNVATDTTLSQLLVPPLLSSKLKASLINTKQNLSPEVILKENFTCNLISKSSNILTEGNISTNSKLSNICQQSTIGSNVLVTNNTSGEVSQASENFQTLHSSLLTTDSEKVILMNAAADFLETQKKITEFSSTDILNTNMTCLNDNANVKQLQKETNNFLTSAFKKESSIKILQKTIEGNQKNEFSIVASGKDEGHIKKNEDKMIPQGITGLSENELISLINPSCFEQDS